MANEKRRLIDANALMKKLSRMIDYCKTDKKVNATTSLFQVGDAIMDCPTVDAVEVEDKELLKAIKLLIKQYDRSKASDYVYDPVAHALYHTWKQVDEGR